jgi:FkbM family methyltransferase
VIASPSLIDRLFRAYIRRGCRGFIRLWGLSGRDFKSTLCSVTSKGSVFELSPFAFIDGIVLGKGYYETEVIDAIASVLDDGVLWDIGANFGLHCMTAKLLFPNSHVICFEPSPEMIARLLRNRALNDLDVEILGFGLSNRTGIETLHVGPHGNPGMSTLSPWSAATYEGTCLVSVVRGDDLVSKRLLPAPTVIKLDVEGHELAVLEGLANTLLSPSLKAVVFEDSRDPNTAVKGLLLQAGFTLELLERSESSRHGLDNFAAHRPGREKV